jgi:hypothetical protein
VLSREIMHEPPKYVNKRGEEEVVGCLSLESVHSFFPHGFNTDSSRIAFE